MARKHTTPNETGDINEDETGAAEVIDETTDLAVSSDGAIGPTVMDDLIDAGGFRVVRTIKAGNPNTGCVGAYCGMVIGPGEPVRSTLPDGKGGLIENMLPTWNVHPAMPKKVDGVIVMYPNLKTTVNLITPHQLDGHLAQLHKQVQQVGNGAAGFFAYKWAGKKEIKGGSRNINDFHFVERIEATVVEGSA